MKSDNKLGMNRDITRRDFIHGAGIATLGLSLPLGAMAGAVAGINQAYYPPTRTGLRGSHPGSFEAAHKLAREGGSFPDPRTLNEEYDLVVVGAGISGLAAAHYYRARYGANARILLLENHDDFGGHARRNEFHQGGQMRLALGGTHNLEHWSFSATVLAYMEELGVDVDAMRRSSQFDYGHGARNGAATWFDKETYGQNRLITDCVLKGSGMIGAATVNQFPISKMARDQLNNFYSMRINVLAEMSEDEAEVYLSTTSYVDFLRRHAALGEEAIALFSNLSHGSWGVETRCFSVAEALEEGLPGLQLVGRSEERQERDYPVAMWPDGNASLVRLQLKSLIPEAAISATPENISMTTVDYTQLDRPDGPVKLRLNATAIHAENTDGGVFVDYITQNEVLRVRGRHCVMACYHTIIPHLCPQLPSSQKAAMKYQVKRPMLQTNVLLRDSKAMDTLGIDAVNFPGRMHATMFMSRGINTGGYEHLASDKGAVPVTFFGIVSPPADVVDIQDQHRASRATMLMLTFEDYEREVRTVLDGLLGPAGFDAQRDILAITVNRWPHGYSYDYMDLWDDQWADGEAPHEIAQQSFGNIAMANSDAGADAYTHVAIDEAFRAVMDLPG